MDILIRSSNQKDWEIVQKLNNQVFLADKDHDQDLDLNWPFSKQGEFYYKNITSGKSGKCFIAYVGTIPVGYVALEGKSFDYRKGKYLEIANIGVNPDYRSKGIGKELVRHAVQYGRDQGYNRIYVSAYFQNEKAISFYEKNGFDKIDIGLEMKI